MKRGMVHILCFSGLLTVLFALLYRQLLQGWLLSCAITCGVTAYHMAIRFLSPMLLWLVFRRHYDYRRRWFQEKIWEPGLYRRIQVKQWKETMKAFTYAPEEFSPKHHSREEIIENMCHAEAVHTLIVALSFSSLLFAIPFGAFWVFLITAIGAALFDLCFVIMQRYNRPRLVRLLEKENLREQNRSLPVSGR